LQGKGVECYVRELNNLSYSTFCSDSCKYDIPDDSWQDLLVWGEPERENQCKKTVNHHIECPCREKWEMYPITIAVDNQPWGSSSDSCTIVHWRHKEAAYPSRDIMAAGGSAPLEWFAAEGLPCVFFAGEAPVRDMLYVNFDKDDLLAECHETVEAISRGFVFSLVVGIFGLLYCIACCGGTFYFARQVPQAPMPPVNSGGIHVSGQPVPASVVGQPAYIGTENQNNPMLQPYTVGQPVQGKPYP
jgi:hypothetical protein